MDRPLAFLKQNNRLSAIHESSSEISTGFCKPAACARLGFGYGINHNKNEAAKRTLKPVQRLGDKGDASMRGADGSVPAPRLQQQESLLIALATVIVGYAALWLADLAFKIDFRFWIVALKLMSARQFLIFLIYLVPFTAFFVIALHLLHRNFSTMGAGRGALYLTNILALTLGFIVLLGLQYGILWLTGMLFNPLPDPSFVPLSTIIAI
jgi:hypothetical protein